MDEERNIVQTVLKANNMFKDFSASLLTHGKLLLVPADEGSTQLDTTGLVWGDGGNKKKGTCANEDERDEREALMVDGT